LDKLTISHPPSLVEQTMNGLRSFFQQRGHRPDQAMWKALEAVAQTLEAMAMGKLSPRAHLSSLDPGVGKTRTIIEFTRALVQSEVHHHVGVLICVSRLDEIQDLVREMGLSVEDFSVFTSDEGLNGLGHPERRDARVLFTTQQMIARRCDGRRFSEAVEFHFQGHARAVRVWDESMLPSEPLTVERDAIGSLLLPLRRRWPKVAAALEETFFAAGAARDGERLRLPDFFASCEGEADDVLASLDDHPSCHRNVLVSLMHMSGGVATVRRDGGTGVAILDYRESLPSDLAPILVLDASGRIRETYRQWEAHRGTLHRLPSATKSYKNLRVHMWSTGGGKWAYRENGLELVKGIVETIQKRPSEEWLIVGHLPRLGSCDLEREVRQRLEEAVASNVHFITWGRHHATNDFVDIRNVILAGTLFYPKWHYEALGRASAARPSSEGPYSDQDRESVAQGEHRHLILQAACRGSVRRCDGSDCWPTDLYIIASRRSRIAEEMPVIFPGCRMIEWSPIGRRPRGRAEQLIRIVDAWVAAGGREPLPFSEVRVKLGGMSAANFRRLRRHCAVAEALEHREVTELDDGPYARAFVLREHQARAYGFEDDVA
jgi:hypothetical protein